MDVMQGQVDELKAYALAHYEEGYDVFVECWETDEWEELIRDSASMAEVYEMMAQLVDVWEDRRADAKYYQDNA